MKKNRKSKRKQPQSKQVTISEIDRNSESEHVIEGEPISEEIVVPFYDGVFARTPPKTAVTSWKTHVGSFRKEYYWLQNSLFITALAIILQFLYDLEPFTGANLLITLLVFVITTLYHYMHEFHELKRRHEPLHKYIEGLTNLFSHVSPQLKEHVELQIDNSIKSLNALSDGATVEAPYHDQIAIANSLAKETHTRFFAVSTDKPSRLWKESYYYFDTLEKISASEKARLVVLEWNELFKDYEENKEDFENFVGWHHDNDFILMFYIVKSDDEYQNMVIRNVGAPEYDKDTLTDFLIKDRDCVYGRVEFDPNTDRVRLKFIPYTEGDNMDRFTSYCSLFDSLLKRSQSADIIRQQLVLERRQKDLKEQSRLRNEQSRKDYAEEFIDATQGRDFYQLVCQKIASANVSLHAVDVSDMKRSVACWAYQPEYNGFLEATLTAASNNKPAKRVYIVNKLSHLDYQVEQMWIKQLQAGVELIILDKDTIIEGSFYVDDFILIDRNIGFYLGDELFEQDTLEYGKNLIPRATIDLYYDIFNSLYSCDNAHHFTGAGDVNKLQLFIREHNTH